MPVLSLDTYYGARREAHYRADDYTSGSWPDRSSNGRDLSEATNPPTAVSDGGSDFSNKPVVRFDGTNDILQSSSFNLAQPLTIIVFCKGTLTNSSVKEVIYGSTTTANSPAIRFNAAEIIDMAANAAITGTSGNGAMLTVEAHFNSTASILRVNGAVEASGSVGTAGISAGITLGALYSGSLFWGGDVAEVLIVGGALSDADRRYCLQYANQRYGAALPYPQTSAPTPSSFSSASVHHNANLPAGKKGDLLLVSMSLFGSSLPITPGGWSVVYRETNATAIGGYTSQCLALVLAADSPPATQNFQTLTSSTGAAHTYLVSLWDGNISQIASATAALASVSGSSVNPPGLEPQFGAKNALWMVLGHAYDDDETFSGPVADYSTVISTISGGGTNNGCSIGTCRRLLAASSENPGAMSLSGAEEWLAATLAVPGIPSVPLTSGAGIMAAGL